MFFLLDFSVLCVYIPDSEGSTMKYEEAIIYASGIVILTAINAILVSQFYGTSFHNGMKVRVAVCSLVYRKVSHPPPPPSRLLRISFSDKENCCITSKIRHCGCRTRLWAKRLPERS